MRTFLAAAFLLTATPAFAAQWSVADEASVTLDASVTHDATPDVLMLSVSCDVPTPSTRIAIREMSRQLMNDLKELAGEGSKVRRNGPPSIYNYSSDPTLSPADQQYSGTMNFTIQNISAAGAGKLADDVEQKGCNYTWDARLLYTTTYAKQMKEELMEQIEQKQEFTEELLGTKMNKVLSLSFSTTPDYSGGGYYGGGGSNYDPDTNTMQAVTTLSVTFDIGTGKAAK